MKKVKLKEIKKSLDEKRIYSRYVKRALDLSLSGAGIIVLSPVFAITGVQVARKLGRPVIYKQIRPGLHEKLFKLYKFRTMTEEKDEDGILLPDEKRLTAFGRKLRATSLDEIPELFNILKGDMSIVGPRPLLIEYLPLYSRKQKKRHDVKPGLTGLAQVNGRNAISWEEKFDYDVEYAEDVRFRKDLLIVLKTIKAVVMREGISSETSVTMEAFTGSEAEEQ
jgi:undecaprenyl phosphate N,N'-diacetylbacillosamine 1-phosphate transferase